MPITLQIRCARCIYDFIKINCFFLTQDKCLEEKLQMYKSFVEMNGQDLHKYEDIDVIQCGLQQHKESFIYKDAVTIANQNQNRVYFNLQ